MRLLGFVAPSFTGCGERFRQQGSISAFRTRCKQRRDPQPWRAARLTRRCWSDHRRGRHQHPDPRGRVADMAGGCRHHRGRSVPRDRSSWPDSQCACPTNDRVSFVSSALGWPVAGAPSGTRSVLPTARSPRAVLIGREARRPDCRGGRQRHVAARRTWLEAADITHGAVFRSHRSSRNRRRLARPRLLAAIQDDTAWGEQEEWNTSSDTGTESRRRFLFGRRSRGRSRIVSIAVR
jgi:hypothetical protein